jgi:hypothetical protein
MDLVAVSGPNTLVCPACGWEGESGAESCSVCNEPLPDTEEEPEDETPQRDDEAATPVLDTQPAGVNVIAVITLVRDNLLLIVAGLLLILLTVLIFKQ